VPADSGCKDVASFTQLHKLELELSLLDINNLLCWLRFL